MLTKALVTGIPDQDSNIFKVRIPLFEDTTDTEIIYDALYCYPPGIFGGLNIGDCVYVAFEDNKLNIPVILGKLYIGEHDEYAHIRVSGLDVTNSAKLPFNTNYRKNQYNNELSAKNVYDLVQQNRTIYKHNTSLKLGDVSVNNRSLYNGY